MIKSMTGFAAVTHEDDLAAINVTLRAVNHRYLDLQLRVPSTLAATIIPLDSMPLSLRGCRLATMTTLRPTICSGV